MKKAVLIAVVFVLGFWCSRLLDRSVSPVSADGRGAAALTNGDVNGDGTIGDEDDLNWQDAFKYCESLSFAGHDDWRLPNVWELQSIVDYGRVNPAIDPVFGEVSDRYWSSSHVSYPDFAWGVSFFDSGFAGSVGGVFGIDKGNGISFVRAVRRGP